MKKSHSRIIDGIVNEKGFITDFCEASFREAEQAVKKTSVCADGRRDYRQQPFITIDDQDAKDFDDAIWCIESSRGGGKLIVAIADVAAYVPPGGELDKAAKNRGTSVYLPDRVLPMLPEAISNEACSIKPGVERLCLACEMLVQDGKVREYHFFRGIMKSSNRLNYDESAVLMEEASSPMGLLASLARDFRQKRKDCGGLIIERPEQKIKINGGISCQTVKRNIAHLAIEECMIAANRCAADFIIRERRSALHRIHKKPSPESVDKLCRLLAELGIVFPQDPSGKDFAEAITAADKKSAALGNALLPVILGTLGRAYYAPDTTSGHFGLACRRYMHFTSPIRRYPDLLTQRALIAALEKNERHTDDSIAAVGEHCSEQEVKADKAEWDCRQRLLCAAAKERVGECFSAFVSGTVGFGVFVSVPELNLEGLVRIADIPGYWQHMPKNNSFVQGNSTISLGDSMKVRLSGINPEKGRAKFLPLRA